MYLSHAQLLSRVQLFVTTWAAACQALLSTGIQNTGVGSLFSSPEDLPDSGIEPGSPASQADSLPTELSGKPQGSWVLDGKSSLDRLRPPRL